MHRILRADLINLTSRCFFSPLDADPSRRLPRGPAPSCGEPWAATRARRPSPAPCGMRPSPTGAGTRASCDVAGGGGCATVARPDLRGTAPGLRRRAARPCGGAQLGSTPHGKAQSAAPTSRRLRFSITLPPGRRGTQPPASLRGTMENGPTGQMRSSNPPPGCGGVAPGPAGLGLGPWRTERRSRSVHRLTKMASRRRFRAFVYTVATRVALCDTSVSTTMGCLRHRWSPASAGHPQHTERRPDVRSMRLSNSFLSACFGCPSRTLPLRSE